MADERKKPKTGLLDRLSSRASKIITILVLGGLFLASPLRPMAVFEHQIYKKHADSDKCQELHAYYLRLMRDVHNHEKEHPGEPLPAYLVSMITGNETEATIHSCTYKRS